MKKLLLILTAALAAALPAPELRAGSLDQLLLGQSPAPVSAPASPAAVPAPAAAPAPAEARREWLVLVFINGVNDLGILGFAEKSVNDMEKVGSSGKVALLVEYGALRQDGGASRTLNFSRASQTLYVTADNDPSKIHSQAIFTSNDADMGSGAHLARFAKRALRRYPADKVALVVWNHGAGRLGIAYDDVTKNHMEVDELAAALAQVKAALGRKLDIFATDACLMQMAAVAYELRDLAEVVVGSEEVIPGDSFPYDRFLSKLAADPAMDAAALARHMVDDYGAYYGDNVTLSALRTAALPGFAARLDAWTAAVSADPQALGKAAEENLAAVVQTFSMEDSKDLYDYVKKVSAALPAGHPARHAGRELRDYMKRALLLRATAAPSLPDAHGLAVYLPELRYNSANYEKLAFAADTQWDDFVRLLMEERLK